MPPRPRSRLFALSGFLLVLTVTLVSGCGSVAGSSVASSSGPSSGSSAGSGNSSSGSGGSSSGSGSGSSSSGSGSSSGSPSGSGSSPSGSGGSSSGSSSGSGSSTPAGTEVSQQAARAYDFTDSVALNTHFSYTDTAYYQQPAAIIGAIQKLHIRHIRDGLAAGWVAPNLYSIYAQLAQAGIGADLVLPNPGSGSTAQTMEALLPNYPSVDAIEGPNEYDEAGDPSWAADLLGFLPSIWQLGQTTGLTVFGPSLTQIDSYPELGNVSSFISDANLHAYWGGRNPETGGWGGPDAQNNDYGSLPYDFDELNIDSPGKPVVMTETGYVVNNTPSQNIIPESVEAVYEPRLLLHAWNMGIRRTYVYELMDDPSSPAGIGLLRTDLSPRPAYTALASLMSLISDGSGAFSPQILHYWLDGASSNLETTLLQKQDGSFWLALWNPGCIFDVNAVAPLQIAPQTVTLSVSNGMLIRNVWSFDETGNTSVVSPGAASAGISVNSAVTLVEIAQP